MRALLLTSLLSLAVVAAVWMCRRESPGAADPVTPHSAPRLPPTADATALPPPAAGASPTDAAPVTLEWHEGRLRRRDRAADAGRRTALRVEPVADGIRCPDGRCLPLLNGVASAPALIREAERGALPPVVALVVDADGWEWYEHADGSLTTSRPQRITDQQGHATVQAVTLHVSHLPADAFVAPDVLPTQRTHR